ncbi:hypothetical protein A2Z10_00195 [Candidatus Azambacteria bacterium RBG_16_47_10]|uniref:4Fe-4S ferredoxin-type domain-containing protein n=1 Tax=Candidatus Azambacteria bacterium RBG_16_47_10 TaxID=1797292 RepID=A0A1F5B165_9BACT|nr:MAG: hypothetical protein A2Z10_00195 [Candidatus Azambacteria bacterium RBG_16_47_10]
MAKKYTILHFKDGCIGCGSCAAVCEKYWEIQDDGIAHLTGSVLQKKTKENVYVLELDDPGCNADAQDICPAQVIKIRATKKEKKKGVIKKKKAA